MDCLFCGRGLLSTRGKARSCEASDACCSPWLRSRGKLFRLPLSGRCVLSAWQLDRDCLGWPTDDEALPCTVVALDSALVGRFASCRALTTAACVASALSLVDVTCVVEVSPAAKKNLFMEGCEALVTNLFTEGRDSAPRLLVFDDHVVALTNSPTSDCFEATWTFLRQRGFFLTR